MSSMLREFGAGSLILSMDEHDARERIKAHNANPASSNPIDILLLDWLMPKGDGLSLLKWLRSHKKESVRFLPTIFCSAYTSEDVVIKGRNAGANEVLVKPVSAEKLARRIMHIIEKPRPFVKTPDFFGPDRRRKEVPFNGEEKRRMTSEDIKEVHENE